MIFSRSLARASSLTTFFEPVEWRLMARMKTEEARMASTIYLVDMVAPWMSDSSIQTVTPCSRMYSTSLMTFCWFSLE